MYLVDIDGTLLRSGGAGFVALEKAFVELYGVADAMQSVRPGGKTDPLIVTEGFWATLGRAPKPDEVARVIRRYLQHLPAAVRSSTGFHVFPGVRKGLKRLESQGNLLAVATGNVREAARLKLARAHLEQQFVVGGYGDDSADRPELVRVAAERAATHLGRALAPHEVTVVGDTPRDVEAAHANGFGCIAVVYDDSHRPALQAAGADRIVGRLDEICAQD